MKRFAFLRGLCLAMVLVMCLALPAQAAGLLPERMEQAYQAGRQVEAALSVQLGSGLSLFIPTETFDAVQALLKDTSIVTHWAKDEAGQPAMGLAMSIKDTQLLTGEVCVTDGGFAVTTSLLPGKTLMLPLDSMMGEAIQQQLPVSVDEQTLAQMGEVGARYLGVFAAWAQTSEGVYTESTQEIAATDTRGASVRADHLVVTAEQVKDLLVRLTDEFATDEDLQTLLGQYFAASGTEVDMAEMATAMSQSVQSLTPFADGMIKMDFYQDETPEMVGLDFTMEPLFEELPQTAFAQYDRLIEDGLDSFGFQGKLGFEDGGMAATKINYRIVESHTEPTIDTDLLLLGMVQETAEGDISQIKLTDTRHTEEGDEQEKIEDALEFTMEQLAPDGSAPEDSMPMSAAVNTQSLTSVGSGDDFESDTAATLTFMGMEMGTILVKMTADAYAPEDISGNEVVDLSQATEEEQQALLEEVQTGLTQALMNAVAVLPPELLQMMQG